MLGLVKKIREKFPLDRIYPGDIFISNDPYRGGGSHLPDVAMAAPVFREGNLVMFVGNIAHHADIGGASAGSMAGNLTEIYQEGLRIPPRRRLRVHSPERTGSKGENGGLSGPFRIPSVGSSEDHAPL
jgi:N-methylhydantoinase B